MRTLSMRGALAVLLVVLGVACGGSGTSSDAQQLLQEKADKWAIDQIEKNFHKATTLKDIDLLMSLWAPHATLSIGSAGPHRGRTKSGRCGSRRGARSSPGRT